MLHKDRRFVVAVVSTAEDLAARLTKTTWTGCTAFRLWDLLFLNDSFGPDSAQEYAVVRAGRQIESITFSWCTEAMALLYIYDLLAGHLGRDYGPVTNAVQTPAEHVRCPWCD